MNKIYKVIWSKVKNQYVVVSELAHSSGKQSRTSRSSIRSRIAALVVCGAIAAFGVLPMNSASAHKIEFNYDNSNSFEDGNGTTVVSQTIGKNPSKKDVIISYDVNTGNGLTIGEGNKVVIDLATGTGIYGGQNISGLEFNGKGQLKVATGDGLDLNTENGQLEVKLATNDRGQENSGLIFENNKLKINPGNTLKIEGNKLDVKLADKSLDVVSGPNGGLKVNVKENSGLINSDEGLLIDSNYLEEHAGGSWTAQAGEVAGENNKNQIEVNSDNKTLKFTGDKNIDVTANKDNNAINVALKDNITLGQGENQININGNPSTEDEAALSIGNKFIVGQNGSVQSTVKTVGTLKTNVDEFVFNENGVTIKHSEYKDNELAKKSSTRINGGTINVMGSDYKYTRIEGEKINAGDIKLNAQENESTILGLTNTEWNDTVKENVKNNASEATVAATQGQLLDATELAVQYDSEDKKSVTLGGSKNYIEGTAEDKGGVELTNVAYATGADKSQAVNVEYLEDKTGNLQYNADSETDNDETSIVQNGEDLTTAVGKLDNAVSETKTLAGKHTIITVNDGISAPELEEGQTEGTYSKDGNLQLKQKVNNGQTTYDIKLNPDVNLKGEGENTGKRVWLSGSNGTITATTNSNSEEERTVINGGNVYVGNSVSVGANDDVVITDKDITGLSNTTWDETLADKVENDNVLKGTAATQGQLLDVQEAVDTATTLAGKHTIITVNDGISAPELEEGQTEGTYSKDGNLQLKQKVNDGQTTYDVKLNSVVTLDGNESDNNKVVLDGNNGTISVTNKYVDTDSKPIKTIANTFNFDNEGATFINTTKNGKGNGNGNPVTSFTNIDGGIITVSSDARKDKKDIVIDGDTGEITGLSNTEWEGTTITPNRAATEGQLQSVYDGSVKYWQKQDGTYDKSFIQLEGGEKGTTITHLKDGVVEEYSTEAINGSQLWETQQQIKDVETTANKHTIVSTTEDSNLTVENVAKKGEAANYQVALKDDITLKGDSSSIELTGTKGTIQVNQETAEGTNFTNINGNVVSIGYTNSEGIENAIVIDGGKGTITGLSNTTWDDELAKQVADSEELQGTAATQGQLQQAVSEVSGIVNKGWTAIAGDNDAEIKVTPGSILNFEDDGNITVSGTKESNELKFGLNHNIKLDNIDNEKTMMIFNTDGKNADGISGYIPENYKQGNSAKEFIDKHGGFAIYYANPDPNSEKHDMTGTFGVTTDGMVHAKDVIVYTTSSDPAIKDTVNYSLKEVGDMVSQMATYYNDGKAYTVFSHFTNDADKENPFEVVDENGNLIENASRDISLAVRDDGAVLIGATVKGDEFADDGIRINAETDSDGNNKATITGLENTEWKPKAPEQTPQAKIATFNGETTTTETSRAATEAQLDDLYDAVAVYNTFNQDGSVNYDTIKLRGADYSNDDAHEGGTLITNVAYAATSGDYDGSAAVNVDLLKDTVANVTSQPIESDRYLTGGKLDGNTLNLTVANTQQPVSITGIASTGDIDTINQTIKGINQTITEINDTIKGITTGGTGTGGNNNTDITGGRVDETGNLVLKKDDGSEVEVGQLTDSAVSDVKFDKEKGTLTITNKDNYTGKESGTPITVEGIASKDDIKTVNDTIGVTSKEDLKEKYKDADTAYITDSETMVDADIALDHAVQDLASNDQYLNSRIDSVEKRLGDVEQRIDKVGAMAAAIANLRTMGFDPEAPTEIAVGVGQYKSETGLAIGVFHYPNQDFMLSASLSTSGDEVMGGIGATWRIGRKTAAEKAKDEEKRILAKAEEIKQAAKRAEVKAQADRHAKLLAEREAKGESIRPIENKVEQTQEQA